MESIQEIVTFIANIALTLTFVIGLIFGIAQIRTAERDRRERLTLDTLKSFQTREFAELLRFVNRAEFPKTSDEFNALPAEQYIMFVQFSQQMESLGLLVAEGFIDLDLIDKTLGTFVTLTWKKYKPLFSKMRENDPYLGEYFQWLAERILERVRSANRDPYYLNR